MSNSQSPKRKKRRSGIKPWQWAAIAAMAVLQLFVLTVFVVIALPPTLDRMAIQPVAQAATLTPVSAAPGPAATLTLAKTPTRTPRPTSTRVVSREFVNQQTIEEIQRQASRLRQLEPRAAVPSKFFTHAEMVDYVRQQYAAQQESTSKELALYRALGLVQPSTQVDLEAMVQLVAANIAGFYDPQDKTTYVISDLENMSVDERVTMAHEYAHALQDQYFDLTAYRDRIHTTDQDLAMMALPEGDATIVMALYLYDNTTTGEWDYLAYRAQFADRTVITATGVSTRTTEIVYFPYVRGAQFALALMMDSQGWDGVNRAYANPPQSTAQILHPAQFANHTKPAPVSLPDLSLALGQDWSPAIQADTLGEFVTSVHLDEFLHDRDLAQKAAEGWRGDSFTLWQAPGDRQAFAWQIAWDTPSNVREFFSAYSTLLRTRAGPDVTVEREDTDVHWYSGSGGSGMISRIGNQTLILWGPDRAAVEMLLTAFQ